MSRLLKPRDRILLGLSIISDIFDDIRLVSGLVSKQYEIIYGFTPEKYKKKNLYATVNRMFKANQIEKTLVNGEPVLKITSIGKSKIAREFPLINLQNKKWDGKWRIVVYDIPEKLHWKRDSLRKKLIELGFGMIQESVWATAHAFEDDIREFLTNNSLDDFVYVFISDAYFTGNIDSLVERTWQMDDLNNKYKELIGEYGKITKEEWMDLFFNLLIIDPFLPKELLPKPWYGGIAREMIKKYTIH